MDESREAATVRPADIPLLRDIPLVVRTLKPRVIGGVTNGAYLGPSIIRVRVGAVANVMVLAAGATLVPVCLGDCLGVAVLRRSIAFIGPQLSGSRRGHRVVARVTMIAAVSISASLVVCSVAVACLSGRSMGLIDVVRYSVLSTGVVE